MKTDSFISWTVLSEEALEEARAVIAEVQAKSTVDVLNLGIPLEPISDLLFPGTSTLHTRFRYVVFVPAIIYAMRQYGAPDGAFSTLKKAETSLVGSLNKGTDGKGNIGRRKFDEGKDLRYRPSTTYWAACNRFSLFGENGQERSRLLDAIDGIAEAKNEDIPNEWNMFVRDPEFSKFSERLFRNPKKLIWHEKMSFDLKKSEAEYFKKKIVENHRTSLYFELLKASPRALKLKAGTENLFFLKTKKAPFDKLLEESGNYSRFAMGVNLAYRWALSRHREVYEAADGAVAAKRVTEAHGENFNTWLDGSENIRTWSFKNLRAACQDSGVLNRVDLKKTNELQAFCDDCGKSFRKKPKTALPELAGLISEREEKVRGNSSRFVNPDIEVPDAIHNPPKDEVNPFFFSYRWTQGRSNIVDILEGLRR